MSNFTKALQYVFENEGGFVNDSDDAGGATNMGITIADLSRYYGHPASVDDVRNMSITVASAIYMQDFWKPLDLDEVNNSGVATAIFDQCVLNGLGFIRTIQALCQTPADGHSGTETLAAINNSIPVHFIEAIIENRMEHYRAIVANNPSQGKFLAGWEARCQRLKTLESWA